MPNAGLSSIILMKNGSLVDTHMDLMDDKHLQALSGRARYSHPTLAIKNVNHRFRLPHQAQQVLCPTLDKCDSGTLVIV